MAFLLIHFRLNTKDKTISTPQKEDNQKELSTLIYQLHLTCHLDQLEKEYSFLIQNDDCIVKHALNELSNMNLIIIKI